MWDAAGRLQSTSGVVKTCEDSIAGVVQDGLGMFGTALQSKVLLSTMDEQRQTHS